MKQYIVGVDLGRDTDPTAIVVGEDEGVPVGITKQDGGGGFLEEKAINRFLRVVYIEQIPLKTNYIDIARRLAAITNHSLLAMRAEMYIDATGVGRAVMDILRNEQIKATGITITSGATESVIGDRLAVPKVAIIDSAISLLHQGRISFAGGLDFADVMAMQLQQFKMKRRDNGGVSYENSTDAVHDDLVIALGLVSWVFLKRHGGSLTAIPGRGRIRRAITEPFKRRPEWQRKAW